MTGLKKFFSSIVDPFLAFESERSIPLWILLIGVTVLFTLVGFLLGAYIHPVLLLLFSSIPIYPIYLSQFKVQEYRKAITLVFVWAITSSIIIILLAIGYSSLASSSILSGSSYQMEMFQWIATGVGPEGDPSTFIPQHAINAVAFTILSFASAGFLSLLFGAYQMNYMNYYVGILLSRVSNPTLNNVVAVAAFSWPIYAIIRVIGFISLGVATTIPLSNRIFDNKTDTKLIIRLLLIGLALVIVDIVVKVLVAPLYQNSLNDLIATE